MSRIRPGSGSRADSGPRAIACLAIPSLALECELIDRPGLAEAPVALSDEARARVTEVTPEARQRGVTEGMQLRDAVALCPTLSIVEPRPALVARLAEDLARAMGIVSPLIEEVEPGTVFADLRGTEALYPRFEDVHQAILTGIPGRLRPRLGIANHRFTAHTAARHAAPGSLVCVEPGEDAAFLADLPVDWLALDIDSVERMRLLGIRTCGDLAALPRHAVEAQFGRPGGVAWLAAQGEDPTPVRARPWERERIIEHVQAEPPLVSKESVHLAVDQLLGRALRHPQVASRFVRLIRLRAETERGGLWERTHVLREPTGDRPRLGTALRTLIEYAEFPGPLTLLGLELGGLTAEAGRQRSLFDAERTRRREQLDEMVRHLKVRYGCSPVARVVPVEPWHRLPERHYALMDYEP